MASEQRDGGFLLTYYFPKKYNQQNKVTKTLLWCHDEVVRRGYAGQALKVTPGSGYFHYATPSATQLMTTYATDAFQLRPYLRITPKNLQRRLRPSLPPLEAVVRSNINAPASTNAPAIPLNNPSPPPPHAKSQN